MNILASLGRAAGAWLGLPSGIVPAASLTPGETIPAVRVVSAPAGTAPVASTAARVHKFPKPAVDHEGFTLFQRKTQHEARLKTEFGLHEKLEAAGMKNMTARRKVLADFDRYVAARPLSAQAAPIVRAKAMPDATDDDGVPVPVDPETDPALSGIIDQLTEVLEALKKRVKPDADDAADEAVARANILLGKRYTAVKSLMAVTKRLCVRAQAREKLSPTARTALAFSEQDTIKALTAALSPRVPPVAKVIPSSASISAPVPSKPDPSRESIDAVKAEIAAHNIAVNKLMATGKQIPQDLVSHSSFLDKLAATAKARSTSVL